MPTEREAWVILAAVHGLGPTTFELLLGEHGSAAGVLDLARTAGGRRRIRDGPRRDRVRLPQAMVDAIGEAAREPEAVLDRLARADVTSVTVHDAGYPGRLRRIEEPPPVLFVRGSVAALDGEHAIAVVGTRKPTEAGRRIAARIADALASVGAVVVSGLAVGIDGAAHAAAVATERPTVAVLGSGHGRLYPRAHGRLAAAIVDTGGAIVSELAPAASPTHGTFPRRNRLISGLADASVVVEAAPGSGALITARWALEQGRGCFVVPGSIDAPGSAGCLALLRAYPGEVRVVTGIGELLDDLELVAGNGAERPANGAGASRAAVLALLGRSERAVAGALTDGATSVDELAERTGLAVPSVLGTLTLLEIRGLVVAAYGQYRAAGVLAGAPPGLP